MLLLLLPWSLYSQDSTSKQTQTRRLKLQDYKHKQQPWEAVDSSIDLIHQFNPAYKLSATHSNLGSYASPVFNRRFEPFTKTTFRTGIRAYDDHLYRPASLRYYDTYTPYTKLFHVQRTNGDIQDLRGVHSRNLTPFWNASIRFNSMRVQGGYLAQLNKQTNIGLNTRFQTPNGRYRGYLSGIWNDLSNQENGGIADPQEFKSPETDNRLRLGVNLQEAFSTYQTRDFTYDHFLFLGNEQRDTVYEGRDTFLQRSIASPLQIHHQVSYQENSYTYRDENLAETDSFYPAVLEDSTLTYDSQRFARVRNTVTIGNFYSPDSLTSPFRFRVGAGWHVLDLDQGTYGADTVHARRREKFQNIRLKGRLRMEIGQHQFRTRGQYFPAGRYQGDFKWRGALHISLDSIQQVQAGYRAQRRQPDFLYKQMQSNHLSWSSALDRPIVNQVFGTYQHQTLNLNARLTYNLMNNFTYYDENIEPSQQKAPLNTIALNLKHRFQVGPFYWHNKLLLQEFSNPDIVRMPNWLYRSSLYYKQSLFDDNLLLSAGLDFRYSQAYKGKAYFPAYNLRYLQNQQTVAGYPVFDAHLNFRIGRFRGFFKLLHINKGISGNDYFTVPEYPLHPRMLTIGIKWMFFS